MSKLITWRSTRTVEVTAQNSPQLSAREVRKALLNPLIVASKRINVVLTEFTKEEPPPKKVPTWSIILISCCVAAIFLSTFICTYIRWRDARVRRRIEKEQMIIA